MGRSPDYKASLMNTLGANFDFYGKFAGNEFNEQGATATLNELAKWSQALAPLRDAVRNPKS